MSFHILLMDRAGNNLVNADFSPYSRMFFAVKYIYLTLYVVHTCRTAPIYSVPLYLAPLRVRVCTRVGVCARARVCVRPCVCVGARVAALASVVRAILFAYMVDSPAVLPRAGLSANFFEIVFGLSISVQLSSAGMGGAA